LRTTWSYRDWRANDLSRTLKLFAAQATPIGEVQSMRRLDPAERALFPLWETNFANGKARQQLGHGAFPRAKTDCICEVTPMVLSADVIAFPRSKLAKYSQYSRFSRRTLWKWVIGRSSR
jgi:hypothetical protein